MSEALNKVIERASTDAAFRSQLQSSPNTALAPYDLTPGERVALLTGDAGQLRSLGVDVRSSKLDPHQDQEDALDWLKHLMR